MPDPRQSATGSQRRGRGGYTAPRVVFFEEEQDGRSASAGVRRVWKAGRKDRDHPGERQELGEGLLLQTPRRAHARRESPEARAQAWQRFKARSGAGEKGRATEEARTRINRNSKGEGYQSGHSSRRPVAADRPLKLTVEPHVKVAVALDASAELAEGPVWDERARRLLWVDIMAGMVHSFDPESGTDESLDVGRAVGAVALRESGGIVLALEDGFGLLAAGGTEVEMLARVGADDPSIRFNDGKCDPSGRFWAGTMAYDESPDAGALYRLDADGNVEEVLSGVTISNGLAWTADGHTMYHVDTPTQGVDAFEFDRDSGSVGARRRLIDVPQTDGAPDGLTIDDEGCLWLALWGGSSVRRYAPDGRLDLVVHVPTEHVTSCTFGGPDLSDLFITSAREGLDESALAMQPLAGAVFRCRPGARGLPADRFRG